MLETQSLLAVLTFLFATGGTIAVILQRLPGWDGVPPLAKKIIIGLVNIAAPIILIVSKTYIPPDFLAQTPAQIILGVVTAATSFVIHYVDQWLAGLSASAKAISAKAK